MRILMGVGLAGASLILLSACGKPASNATVPSAAPTTAAAPSAAPAAPGILTPGQMPHRKPGLWEQTMSMADVPTGQIPATRVCVDEASDANMAMFGRHPPGAKCAAPQFTRGIDGTITFASQCDMGPNGVSRTEGTISGDFQSSYTVSMTTSISGSSIAAMNRQLKMTVSSRWVGACAAGQKGGDVILPNGMKVSMPGAAGSSPPPQGQ